MTSYSRGPKCHDMQCVIGAADYANSAPLIDAIPELYDSCRMVHRAPAELVADLDLGLLDMALIPVAALLDSSRLQVIPDLGVCSPGPVGSVLLRSDKPLQDIRTLQLDPRSRTSNALAAILIEEESGLRPKGSNNANADAEVIIGDRALTTPNRRRFQFDLAELWNRQTGLGFVFAVWACRVDNPMLDSLAEIAATAAAAGLGRLADLARCWAERLSIPLDRMQSYFSANLRYVREPEDQAGLDRFLAILAGTDNTALTCPDRIRL